VMTRIVAGRSLGPPARSLCGIDAGALECVHKCADGLVSSAIKTRKDTRRLAAGRKMNLAAPVRARRPRLRLAGRPLSTRFCLTIILWRTPVQCCALFQLDYIPFADESRVVTSTLWDEKCKVAQFSHSKRLYN
jgi:hypothetical protein